MVALPDFLHATLGATGREVCRVGLSASYRPGERAIRLALESVSLSEMARTIPVHPPKPAPPVQIEGGATVS